MDERLPAYPVPSGDQLRRNSTPMGLSLRRVRHHLPCTPYRPRCAQHQPLRACHRLRKTSYRHFCYFDHIVGSARFQNIERSRRLKPAARAGVGIAKHPACWFVPTRRCWLTTVLVVAASVSTGCVSAPSSPANGFVDRVALRREALANLEVAIGFRQNPVVRVEAIEAMQASGEDGTRPWIRTALTDEHPAVRFAACVATGVLRDADAQPALRSLTTDRDARVRMAACFALHRMGDHRCSGAMPKALLEDRDATVRRNAALLLGLLDEPGAIKVLARAMKDRDEGVRHHVLEALTRLGNHDAAQELLFMTNAGVGSEEVFAITALASTRNPAYFDTFAYKLATAPHVETQLAAARGLGWLGDDRGFELALRSLRYDRTRQDPNDPPGDQILRVRQLAAGALGAIGRPQALAVLARIMRQESDPRMQVSAAKAILEILRANSTIPPTW